MIIKNKETLRKLKNVFEITKKNLNISLYYVNCESLDEFYKNENDIKLKHTFHMYDDAIKSINHYKKLENTIKILESNI